MGSLIQHGLTHGFINNLRRSDVNVDPTEPFTRPAEDVIQLDDKPALMNPIMINNSLTNKLQTPLLLTVYVLLIPKVLGRPNHLLHCPMFLIKKVLHRGIKDCSVPNPLAAVFKETPESQLAVLLLPGPKKQRKNWPPIKAIVLALMSSPISAIKIKNVPFAIYH